MPSTASATPRESRLSVALLLSLAAQASTVLSGTVSVPLFLAAFGAERYGFWGALLGLTSYLRVLNLGVAQTVSSDLARKQTESPVEGSIATIRHGLRVFLRMIAVAFPVVVVAAYFTPWTTMFHAHVAMESEFRLVGVIVVATFLIELPSAVLRSAAVGLGGISVERFVVVVTGGARLAVAALAVQFHLGLASVVWSLFLVSMGAAVALAVWLAVRLPGVFHPSVRVPTLDASTRGKFRFASGHFLALQIAGAVVWSSDPFLAGLADGTTGAARVAVGWRVLSLVLMAGGIIGPTVAPGLVRALARGATREVEELLTVSAATSFAVATGGAVLLLFGGRTLFDLWLRPGMYMGNACWGAYLALIMVQAPLGIAHDFVCQAGEHAAYSRMAVAEAVVKIAVAAATAPFIGLLALPVSSLAGRALTAPLLVRSTARLVQVPTLQWLWRVARPSALPTVAAALICVLFRQFDVTTRAGTLAMLLTAGSAFVIAFFFSPVPRSFLRLARASRGH